jgi:hypothetical protein
VPALRFLHDDGDGCAGFAEDQGAVYAAAAGGHGRILIEEQPVVHVGRGVEPDGVIEAGDLHGRIGPGDGVGEKRCIEHGHVAGIGEQGAGDGRGDIYRSGGAAPMLGTRRQGSRVERIGGIDGAEIDGAITSFPDGAEGFGRLVGVECGPFGLALQRQRIGR